MADNVTVDNGSGTDYTVATNELTGGEQAQVVQLIASDAATADDRVPASETDGLLVNLGANNDVTVSGVSTAANQTTMIGHLDGVEGLLTTIDADTGTLAGAVSGTEVQVDVVAALPAGTNNIGDVDILSIAAGDNNIGNVDVVTLPSIPAGTNNIGDVDVLTLPALPAGNNNIGDVDIATIAAGDNNIGNVDIVSLPNEGQQTMANSISVAVASDQATFPVTAAGAAAHASPTSGNPVYIAGRASNAIPTDVGADGDAAGFWMNRNGAQMVSMAPHLGIMGSPWTLTGETAQYTTTQTSTVLVAGGASERLVVTKVQIQAGGTTAGTLQLYFGTGAYSRGTNLAIFDGEFAPSATLKPGVVMDGPFISATNGDDLLVTDSAAINPLTITVWYYVVT